MEKIDEVKVMLEELAKRKCWCDNDDFSADDYSGDNFDDAYSGGYDDGESKLAQKILEMLKS